MAAAWRNQQVSTGRNAGWSERLRGNLSRGLVVSRVETRILTWGHGGSNVISHDSGAD